VDGVVDGEGAHRLHQPARDPDRNCGPQGGRSDSQCLRRRRQVPADCGDVRGRDDIAETLRTISLAAEDAGFDEDTRHQISMAARECLVNAVVHGNRYNRNKTVHLSVATEDGRFTIRIRDQGEGFERAEVPDPLHEENVLRHSGRGLFLMEAFMDEMTVQQVSPSGTEVTLVKNLG